MLFLEEGLTMTQGGIAGGVVALLASILYFGGRFVKWFADTYFEQVKKTNAVNEKLASATLELVQEVRQGGEESKLDRRAMDSSSKIMIRAAESLDIAVRELSETNKLLRETQTQ